MTVESALDAQARFRSRLIDDTTRLVTAAWDSLPSTRGPDVAAFVNRVVPVVMAAQRTTGALTSTYLATVIADVAGTPVRPVPAGDVTTARGVDPPDVYRRPFVSVYTALSTGTAYDRAVAIGRDRLVRLVADDLSLAHRRASLMSLSTNDRVTGFRRVIRPELTRSGTCSLCRIAATNTYRTDELLPIHTRCECDVLPIVGTRDPGAAINDADTAGLAPVPADVDVVVREHGELGPVLQRAGVDFTGPGDLAA